MADLEEFAKQQIKAQLKAGGMQIAKQIAVKVLIPVVLPIVLIIGLIMIIILALCGGFEINTENVRAALSTEGVITNHEEGYSTYNEDKLWEEIQERLKGSGTTLQSMGLGEDEEQAKEYLTKFLLAEFITSYMYIDENTSSNIQAELDNKALEEGKKAEKLINGAVRLVRYNSDGEEIRNLKVFTQKERENIGKYVGKTTKMDTTQSKSLTSLMDKGYYVLGEDIIYYVYTTETTTIEKGKVENEDDQEIQNLRKSIIVNLTIKEQKINFKTVAEKYKITFDWFLALTATTRCPEYAVAFADYVIENTDIVIAIQDSKVTTTHTEEYTYNVTYTYKDEDVYDILSNVSNSYDWWYQKYLDMYLKRGMKQEEAEEQARNDAGDATGAEILGNFQYVEDEAKRWCYRRFIQNNEYYEWLRGWIMAQIRTMPIIEETIEGYEYGMNWIEGQIRASYLDEWYRYNYEKLEYILTYIFTATSNTRNGANVGDEIQKAIDDYCTTYRNWMTPTVDEILFGVNFDGVRQGGFCSYYDWKPKYYDPVKTSNTIYKVVATTETEEVTAFAYVQEAFSWFLNTEATVSEPDKIDEKGELALKEEFVPKDIRHDISEVEVSIEGDYPYSTATISTVGEYKDLSTVEKITSKNKVKTKDDKVGTKYKTTLSTKETDNADILIGFWKNDNGSRPFNDDGSLKKKEDLDKFNLTTREGKVVKYESLITGREDSTPGDNLVKDRGVFFEMISGTEDGQVQETVMRYLLYKYTGIDYGVTKVYLSDLRFYISLGMNSVISIEGDTTRDKLWYALKSVNLSDIQAAAVMANIQAESGFRTNNLENTVDAYYGGDVKYTQDVNDGKISREEFIALYKRIWTSTMD